MRKPARPLTRPLLFAGAGLAVLSVAAGCLTSGNLVAPPPCDAGTHYDDTGECVADQADAGTEADAGVDAGP